MFQQKKYDSVVTKTGKRWQKSWCNKNRRQIVFLKPTKETENKIELQTRGDNSRETDNQKNRRRPKHTIELFLIVSFFSVIKMEYYLFSPSQTWKKENISGTRGFVNFMRQPFSASCLFSKDQRDFFFLFLFLFSSQKAHCEERLVLCGRP